MPLEVLRVGQRTSVRLREEIKKEQAKGQEQIGYLFPRIKAQ